ncbi:MAG: hypothetical protein KatS3mg032_0712 [Cyclobacteriaceae bacterium]|nr:MAG: hypothetical protein KatS3mg032_0712 [Cyclobacteriaceae bacterium]
MVNKQQNQAPRAIFMVRPVAFGFNPDTAHTNAYQHRPVEPALQISQRAVEEFDRMVDLLQAHDVQVHVFNDTPEPPKPDAVFPNNWLSFHDNGTVVLYPMQAHSRRAERRPDWIAELERFYQINRVLDLSHYEHEGMYLEGTGSLVFDYAHRVAYAARSPRTHEELVHKLCDNLEFEPVIFDAFDESGMPVYHTNVILAITSRLVLICLDAIPQYGGQDALLDRFRVSGRKIVAISHAQVRAFAGNMMEVQTRQGQTLLVMSGSAYRALLPGQLDAITQHTDMLVVDVPTIERYGGGSVRCMMAGIFNCRLTGV